MILIHFFLITLLIGAIPVFAQEHQSTSDIMTTMKNDLNLSDDQVAGITQVIDRYVDASNDLQKSIEDGTMNPSAIDSQKQQIKAAEYQGISQYLRSDQLSEWNNIQSQMDRQKDTYSSDSNSNADTDEYSNMPRSAPPQ